MYRKIFKAAREIAINDVLEAGKITKTKFEYYTEIKEKGENGDVVTEVDYLSEKIILHKIHSMFPDHQVDAEESGNNNVTVIDFG